MITYGATAGYLDSDIYYSEEKWANRNSLTLTPKPIIYTVFYDAKGGTYPIDPDTGKEEKPTTEWEFDKEEIRLHDGEGFVNKSENGNEQSLSEYFHSAFNLEGYLQKGAKLDVDNDKSIANDIPDYAAISLIDPDDPNLNKKVFFPYFDDYDGFDEGACEYTWNIEKDGSGRSIAPGDSLEFKDTEESIDYEKELIAKADEKGVITLYA